MIQRRTPTIAVLVDYIVSSYQVGIVRAVERVTKTNGVSLLTIAGRALHSTNVGDATQNRVYDLLGSENVDGIILVSGCMSWAVGPAALEEYCTRYRPTPVCSIGVELPGIPSLIISNEQGSRAIVEHLIVRHAKRKIAYIGGPAANREAVDRYAGYLAALRAHGIEFDESLFDRGDFGLPAGMAAMERLLARHPDVEAVVAANDYMAMGAAQALRATGRRIPSDVLLAGFDDAPFSRFALPSLTTVRQPLDHIARSAVDWLLASARGKAVPMLAQIDVELIARQSCGCGITLPEQRRSSGVGLSREGVAAALQEGTGHLEQAILGAVGVPPNAFGGWAGRLLDALYGEVTGTPGQFLAVLSNLLEEALPQADLVDEFVKIVPTIRRAVGLLHPTDELALELEQVWHEALIATSNASTNAQGREKLELQVVIDAVREGFERIGTALSLPTLRQAVAGMLPDIHIHHACVSLVDEAEPALFSPFVVAGHAVADGSVHAESFAARQLVPEGFFGEQRHSHIVLPLSFEEDFFGLVIAEYTTNEAVYGLLRDHISSALKGGMLHRNALRQAALRERAEREQIEQEAQIAARIQTAILPQTPVLEGWDVHTHMSPTSDVGGDYYDVIPIEGGCWLGIGDVTGHGLIAGIIMLMVQGMVASLVRRDPDADPAALLPAVNRALWENIKKRLVRDDYVTMTLLRCDRDGQVTFAGAHEDLIWWHRSTGAVEFVPTPGIWSGAIRDVCALTQNERIRLEAGDLLVLYTDGATEAMNERHEQFGLARLGEVIARHATKPVAEIVRAALGAVGQWQQHQHDDISFVVARYTGVEDES